MWYLYVAILVAIIGIIWLVFKSGNSMEFLLGFFLLGFVVTLWPIGIILIAGILIVNKRTTGHWLAN